MGGLFSSVKASPEEVKMALPKAQEVVSNNPVVVFSKTYCPFCTRVKQLLSKLGAQYKVVELDVERSPSPPLFLSGDGNAVQAALLEWTGQRTVPNVFIGGNHIGGCDAVTATHNQGKLVPLLTNAGALPDGTAS